MVQKSQPTVDDLLALTKDAIYPFLQIYRATPLGFVPGRYENDAEHSWSLALVACALAQHIDEKLDTGKIAQFATVHDMVEIHAGDTSNFASADELATKDERERAAFQKLKKDLAVFPWICENIEAYEKQDADEAIFVKCVDKILPMLSDVLEEGSFYKQNHITTEDWQRMMQPHRKKASKHPGVFKYYDELWNLILANPQFFHRAEK